MMRDPNVAALLILTVLSVIVSICAWVELDDRARARTDKLESDQRYREYMGRVMEMETPPPRPALAPSPLHYCPGCGCRHRETNMHWVTPHLYHCTVCCKDRDKEFAHG